MCVFSAACLICCWKLGRCREVGVICAWDVGEEGLECCGRWEYRGDVEDVEGKFSSFGLTKIVAEH